MKLATSLFLLACCAAAQIRTVALPGKSPLVTFRIVFTTGSAADPADKPGLAYLTAQMIADGGTKDLTYKQIGDALFPMASSVNAQVDKEMCTFGGATHVDNLDAYYKLLRGMLLTPGWREDDFRRVKDDAINAIKVGLRGNNDEELGKEVLYETLYQGTPYGHLNTGTISSLEKITLDDVKAFYKSQYTPVAAHYRNRGRLFSGVPDGHEKRLPGAAGHRGSPAQDIGAGRRRKIARRDRGQRYAKRRLLDRLSDRCDARAPGLCAAAAGVELPRAAPHEQRRALRSPARKARPELRRLRLHRIFPPRHVPDGAAAQPGAASADLPGVDPPGGTADREIRLAPRALRTRQVE